MSEPAEMGEDERRGERQDLADQLVDIFGRLGAEHIQIVIGEQADSAQLDPKSNSVFMNIKGAAGFLKMGVRTVRRLVAQNRVPVQRLPSVGGGKCKLLFDRDALTRWVRAGCPKPNLMLRGPRGVRPKCS